MAKTLEQKLCKRSLGYVFVRDFWARPALHLFYRKINVLGAKKVPDKGAVIFAPNHQNALMDALAVICTKDRQPVFVARADIFKKPMIIAIFHFLRILPIYRKRDGGNSVDNNQETFDLILKVLNSSQSVGIMPEGAHNEIKRLRVLQKGIFRLAMQAQENSGTTPNVKIVPVGIEYTNPSKFRNKLLVRYGEAIELSDFYEQYTENPAKAFKQMQDKLTEKMKEGMIHIESEQYYSVIERIRVMYLKRAMQKHQLNFRRAEDVLQTQKNIISAIEKLEQTNPEEISSLALEVEQYFELMQKHNFRDWVIEKQPYSIAGIAVRGTLALTGIPFWIIGMIFNYLPYKLSEIASRKVKDPQFISSVQFVAGLVVFPLYYFAMIAIILIFVPFLWGKLLALLSIIPMGLFAYEYYLSVKKLYARLRFWANKNTPEMTKAVELRKNIFMKMEKIY